MTGAPGDLPAPPQRPASPRLPLHDAAERINARRSNRLQCKSDLSSGGRLLLDQITRGNLGHAPAPRLLEGPSPIPAPVASLPSRERRLLEMDLTDSQLKFKRPSLELPVRKCTQEPTRVLPVGGKADGQRRASPREGPLPPSSTQRRRPVPSSPP